MPERIVIALGGNALQSKDSGATAEAQLEVVKKTSAHIAQISQRGYEMAVVHGNGPQVGRIVLASEAARDVAPPMPFDVCGAMSQGYIGYHIQQALKYALNSRNRNYPVVTLATQVVVDRNDPAFQNPTKPIGAFYTQEEARQLEAERGYTMREDAGRGWRRVVPSPLPRRIVEIEAIRLLWDHAIVVACGADVLLILTEVEKAAIRFGKPDQEDLSHISLAEAARYAAEGQFGVGSMLPKIEAAMKFVRANPGKKAIITSLDKALEALDGKTGTVVTFA